MAGDDGAPVGSKFAATRKLDEWGIPKGRRPVDMDLQHFVRDEEGQGLVEYALIIAVIAIAVIVAMVFLRDQISNIFSDIGNNLT
jgi:pilus assembly protein Flp/PilA